MPYNYTNKETLESIVDGIKGTENVERKKESLKQFEIFQDRLKAYVQEYLRSFYSPQTLLEIPIVSSVNLARRIVIQEASLYKTAPVRTFEGVTEDQAEVLQQIYKDMNADQKMLKVNQYFKLQQQAHFQILPYGGELMIRVLLPHHFDVVPKEDNVEKADAFIINGFDKSSYVPRLAQEDGLNQLIADVEDYKANLKAFALWSNEQNFIFNESGIITSPDVVNPLGIIPIVEVSSDKDFEYFVRPGSAVTDFTIQFNGALSDFGQVIRMQGFAQAWMKGPENLIPQNMQIGPNFIVKLPVDPNNPVDTEFGYANPNPDIGGMNQYLESLMSTFLSSRGLDPKLINSKGESQQFTSGLDRFLAMIDRFEASQTDISAFQRAEDKMFEVVKKYIDVYAGTEFLKYKISPLSQEAKVNVAFSKPGMVMSDADKIQIIRDKLDLGLMSTVEAIAFDRDISKEAAEEVAEEIREELTMARDAADGEDEGAESLT
jgi:hypothetical protein